MQACSHQKQRTQLRCPHHHVFEHTAPHNDNASLIKPISTWKQKNDQIDTWNDDSATQTTENSNTTPFVSWKEGNNWMNWQSCVQVIWRRFKLLLRLRCNELHKVTIFQECELNKEDTIHWGPPLLVWWPDWLWLPAWEEGNNVVTTNYLTNMYREPDRVVWSQLLLLFLSVGFTMLVVFSLELYFQFLTT